MSEYKRMVSYLYKYENGAKGRNIGYVRIEVRQGDLKLLVSIKDPKGLNDVSYKVYFYYHEGRRLKGISGGEMLLKRGEGVFRTATKEEAVFKSSYSLDDMGGMIIYYNNELAYGTEWDDHAIQMHYFEVDSMAIPPVPKEENREDAETGIQEEEKKAKIENINEQQTPHQNSGNLQKHGEPQNQSQSQLNIEAKGNASQTESMQQQTGQTTRQTQQMKQQMSQTGQVQPMQQAKQQMSQTGQIQPMQQAQTTRQQVQPAQQPRKSNDIDQDSIHAQSGPDAIESRAEEVKETVSNGTSNVGQQRNGLGQPRSVVNLGRMAPQNNQNIEAAEVTAEIASEAAVSQEDLKAESLDLNYDSTMDHLVKEKRANNQQQNRNKGPQPYGNYWQNDRRQFNNRQQNGRRMRQNQPASVQPEMMIQNSSNTPNNNANSNSNTNPNNNANPNRNNWQGQQAQSSIQSYIMESLMKNNSQGNSSNAAGASSQGSNSNEFQTKLEQFTEVIQQMQQVMQPPAASGGQSHGNLQQQTASVDAYKPTPESSPEPQSVSNAAPESAPVSEASVNPMDTKEDNAPDSSQLEALLRDCPRLPNGGNNQIIESVRITPQEIGKLDRSNWKFGNNSFLIHGFYNYHYLMLGRIGNERGEVMEVLGVPGIFDNRAKYMAGQFGFNQFIPAKPTPLNTGAFGYWIVELSRENRI